MVNHIKMNATKYTMATMLAAFFSHPGIQLKIKFIPQKFAWARLADNLFS